MNEDERKKEKVTLVYALLALLLQMGKFVQSPECLVLDTPGKL